MLKKTILSIVLLLAVALPAIADDKAATPPPPPMTEDQAIAALAPESPWAQKEIATRRLRQIGTDKAVPALAALLTDDKVSHLARYALETNPSKAASEALRKAAAEAKGASRAGAIISLGARKDEGAVDVVAAALKDSDTHVVNAAAGTLGRIGTAKAADVLLGAAANHDPNIGEGLLAAADALTAAGKGAKSVEIAEELHDAAWPEHVRLGAFRALVLAEPRKADERLLAALAGDDAKQRDFAAFLVATVPSASKTQTLSAGLAKLPAPGQAALLSGLGGRKDAAAHDATIAALDSADATVRAGALKALAAYATAVDVARIAGLLEGDEAVVAAAKNSLTELRAKGTDDAIAKASTAAQPKAKALLLAVLSDRMAPQTNAIAGAALADADADVRIAALAALGKLGTKDDVPGLLAAIGKTTDQSERAAGANALNAIAGVQKDEALSPITGALGSASVEFRAVLLGALVRIGSGNALQAYLGELKDPKKEGRDEAVRLFTQWPTRDAAAPMLEMAKTDETHRSDLMRGYVRLAKAEGDVNVKTQMLTDAMALAQRPEEKWIVLPGWGSLATAHSIEVLSALLADEKVHNEAGIALISAAREFGKQGEDQKKVAIEALKKVVEKTEAKDGAKNALKTFGVDLDAPASAAK